MAKVKAIRKFSDGSKIHAVGDVFNAPENKAKDYEQKGLVLKIKETKTK